MLFFLHHDGGEHNFKEIYKREPGTFAEFLSYSREYNGIGNFRIFIRFSESNKIEVADEDHFETAV